jgi:predicted RNA-binding Zn-ribbon protein involved in translation (DUF1610 family)
LPTVEETLEETIVTRIRASCPGCGEVDLRPDDVTLRVVRAPDGLVGDGSSYRFACPDCDEVVTKPADERIAQLLSTGGVPIEDADAIDLMAELAAELRPPHPERPTAGPPLTPDDLLDLHLLLSSDGWFDEFAGSTSDSAS